MQLNDNVELVEIIFNKLIKNKKEHGNYYCPCKLQKIDDNVCPCAEFKATKHCHCTLYQDYNEKKES